MARYCITPILYGVLPGDEMATYHAAISPVAPILLAIIPSKPGLPDPKYNFCACRFETSNVAVVAQISNTYILPDYPLDGLLQNMDPATRTAMVQSVQAYDIDGQGLHISLSSFGDSSRFRDVIEHIAHVFEPLAWLDVPNA